MKATLALLLSAAAFAKANPGGGVEGGYGPHEGYTEYTTHVYTTAVVSHWYETRPSTCTTYSTWKPPPVTSVYTTISTYTQPGKTKWTTEYVPCTTTIPGKDTTYTKETTYTTEITDTHSTTIYKPTTITDTIIITSNNTITLATTQTVPTTQLVTTPTTILEYSWITKPGTTEKIPYYTTIETTIYKPVPTTIPTTEYYPSPSPTTIVETSLITKEGSIQTTVLTRTKEDTVLKPVSYTITQETTLVTTLTEGGTTRVVTTTQPADIITKSGPTVTIVEYSTISLSGTTEVVSLPPIVEYSTISLSGTTEVISLPPIVEYSTISLGGTTEVISLPPIVQPGTTLIEYSTISANGTTEVITIERTETLPQVTVVDSETIIQSQPGETIYYTASAPMIISYVTITKPAVTITQAPPPPASTCNGTGFFPAPDGNACGGESCFIDFDLDAAVHWAPVDDYPPLLTVAQFENPSAKATCITTICNTAAFDKYYTRSIASCARPPCPSNSLDCDCNIVVGPLVLPNGQKTSVTQTSTSGWYLNLGPSVTANYIPTCDGGSPQCMTAVPTIRPEPLIYTGNVINPSITGNMSYAMPTQFLLPQLPGYFPRDSPFGDCETAVFEPVTSTTGPRLRRAHLHRRLVAREADPGQFTWPATPSLTHLTTYGARARADILPSSNTPAPSPSSVTVTETAAPEDKSSPANEPTPSSPPDANQPAPTSTTTEQTPPPETTPTPAVSPSSDTTGENSPQSSGSSALDTSGTSPTTGAGASPPPTGPETPPSTTSGESIGSSIAIPTSETTGADGKVTVTETVFYSMIPPPDSSNSTSGASSTPARQTGGVGRGRPQRFLMAVVVLMGVVLLL